MPTKNIECQLAQGQIGRYLNGDRISPGAVKALEEHVGECSECAGILTTRKEAILTMLSEDRPIRAVIQTEASDPPAPAREAFAATLAAKMGLAHKTPLAETARTETGKAQPVATEIAPTLEAPSRGSSLVSKPLLYSTALAVVLMIMSYFSRGAVKAFGPTASSMIPVSHSVSHAPATRPARTLRPIPKTVIFSAPRHVAPKKPTVTKAVVPHKPIPKIHRPQAAKPIPQIRRPEIVTTVHRRTAMIPRPRNRRRYLVFRTPRVARHPIRVPQAAHKVRPTRTATIHLYDPQGHPIKAQP